MRTPDWQSEDGLIALHNCKAETLLDSMSPKSVDIVTTSPPYNTLQGETEAYGFRARRKGGDDKYLAKIRGIGYSDHRPEQEYQHWLAYVVSRLIGVTRGPVWVNHKLRYRDDAGIFPVRFLPFDVWCRVIWWRKGSMAQNCRKFKPSTEEIYAFGSRGYWDGSDNENSHDVWPGLDDDTPDEVWDDVTPQRGSEEHACPWPIEAPLRLIKRTCPPGGIVLDPFMGRATAALATLRAGDGRRFIGCDDDARAFAAAVEFISREYDRPILAEQGEQQRKLFEFHGQEQA